MSIFLYVFSHFIFSFNNSTKLFIKTYRKTFAISFAIGFAKIIVHNKKTGEQCSPCIPVYSLLQKNKTASDWMRSILAGVLGFEPRECWSQSPMPYRLAIPQNLTLNYNITLFLICKVFF